MMEGKGQGNAFTNKEKPSKQPVSSKLISGISPGDQVASILTIAYLLRIHRDFLSTHRKKARNAARNTTMTIQWLTPRTSGMVIFP